MTQNEINALGIAFFSGKTLQFRHAGLHNWNDFTGEDFPRLRTNPQCEWRIKPNEPKKEIWCTLRHTNGAIVTAVKDSVYHGGLKEHWTHIPSLDREVILPEGAE